MNKHQLTTATPAQIDAELASLQQEEARLLAQLERNRKQQQPLNAEYQARGGWARAFLVNNTSGHVHSSTGCSSCFPTTQYKWVTDLSGATQEQIIDAAGWRACTVCYPDAPVEALKADTKLLSDEDHAKAARKAEADAAKAEKAAKAAADACPMPDGSPVVLSDARPKTERAVRNALSSTIKSALHYRLDRDGYYGSTDGVNHTQPHPSEPEWLEDIAKCLAALAHRTGESQEAILAAALDRCIKAERRGWRKVTDQHINLEGAAAALGWA